MTCLFLHRSWLQLSGWQQWACYLYVLFGGGGYCCSWNFFGLWCRRGEGRAPVLGKGIYGASGEGGRNPFSRKNLHCLSTGHNKYHIILYYIILYHICISYHIISIFSGVNTKKINYPSKWRHAESCVHRVVRQMIGWINIILIFNISYLRDGMNSFGLTTLFFFLISLYPRQMIYIIL